MFRRRDMPFAQPPTRREFDSPLFSDSDSTPEPGPGAMKYSRNSGTRPSYHDYHREFVPTEIGHEYDCRGLEATNQSQTLTRMESPCPSSRPLIRPIPFHSHPPLPLIRLTFTHALFNPKSQTKTTPVTIIELLPPQFVHPFVRAFILHAQPGPGAWGEKGYAPSVTSPPMALHAVVTVRLRPHR